MAHSLAGQIWNLEERAVACHDHTATAAVTGTAAGACAGGGGLALPQPGGDWAANIVIHLSEGRTNGSANEGYDDDDVQAVLDSFLEDEEPKQPPRRDHHDDDGNGGSNDGENGATIEYLKVVSATINTPNDTIRGSAASDAIKKMQRIHSLGLVFYEIFSGGESPPSPPTTNNINSGETSEFADLSFDPLPHEQADGTVNLASALDILDLFGENGVNEEHELMLASSSPGVDRGDDSLEKDTVIDGAQNNSNNNGRKKQARRSSRAISTLKGTTLIPSMEPLKLKGIPTPLCDLIYNMIDSINGDLSGNEAYKDISDVKNDLQLMTERPVQFLYELDLDRLSVTGLKLNETTFGREEEFARIKSLYLRSTIGGGSALAIITGPSGSGKSSLAMRLGRFVRMRGGIFLSGKFDQLQQTMPFSAVASAFNEYCDILVREHGSVRAKVVASKLRIALGHDAYHLVKVIPNLSSILGEDVMMGQFAGQDCVDAQKRLYYLLCQFVEVISSFSEAPVTLFLDDLQWADSASLSVINQLLLVSGSMPENKRFFFLGCCREKEMNNDHPFWTMLSSVSHFGVNASLINLDCMDKDTINKMISNLLCLSPRLTRTLSGIVHHKTKGSPLFFSRLIQSLNRDGLLWLSLSRRRWEWDEEKIQARQLPDDVAVYFTSTITRLPHDVQAALCVLSCFGASTECSLMQTLEGRLNMPLVAPLDVAATEGLLDTIGGHYRFVHDRVQESAYNMMRPDERCLYHFRYGLALASISMVDGNDSLLFRAVSQINHGGPAAVENDDQGNTIANLNLIAGELER